MTTTQCPAESIDKLKDSFAGSYRRDIELGDSNGDSGGSYAGNPSAFAEEFKLNLKGSLNPS